MNNSMEEVYTVVKRFSALILGIFLLGISIWFSAEGLNFNMTDSFIFGIVLALAVTVFELIFDEDGFRGSITMGVIGVFAYGYGIISNYYGIWVRQGMPDETLSKLFAGILAVFVEVAPEQLILWSLGLTGRGIRDMLSGLGDFSKKNNVFRPFQDKYKRGDFPGNVGQGHPETESFNPSNKHVERLKEQHGVKNKSKRQWQPGSVGRPPKNRNDENALSKILGQDVTEER